MTFVVSPSFADQLSKSQIPEVCEHLVLPSRWQKKPTISFARMRNHPYIGLRHAELSPAMCLGLIDRTKHSRLYKLRILDLLFSLRQLNLQPVSAEKELSYLR